MNDILDQQWRPSPDAFANAVGEETVLLHVKRSVYYGMDPLGTRIWRALNEGRNTKETCREIAAEHDVPVAQVEEDTRRFLEDLKANEIIVAK